MQFTTQIAGTSLRPGELLAWIIVGLLAGFFASRIIRGRGYGCLGNILVGLLGAVIGGFVASLLGINETFHFWGTTLIAFLGACILVIVLQAFSGGRKA